MKKCKAKTTAAQLLVASKLDQLVEILNATYTRTRLTSTEKGTASRAGTMSDNKPYGAVDNK